jgi:hypothetical protein
MTHGYSQNYKKRVSVLVFLKGLVSPIVLYVENPNETYSDLVEIMKTQNSIPKIIEKETNGPIKKVSFLSNQISAIAIQEEPIV